MISDVTINPYDPVCRKHGKWNFTGDNNPCKVDMLTYVNQNKRIDSLISSGEKLETYRESQCLEDYESLILNSDDFSKLEAELLLKDTRERYLERLNELKEQQQDVGDDTEDLSTSTHEGVGTKKAESPTVDPVEKSEQTKA